LLKYHDLSHNIHLPEFGVPNKEFGVPNKEIGVPNEEFDVQDKNLCIKRKLFHFNSVQNE